MAPPHYKSMGEISIHPDLRQNDPKRLRHTKRSVYYPVKLTGAPLTSAMSGRDVIIGQQQLPRNNF